MTRTLNAVIFGCLLIASASRVYAQDVIELPLRVQSGDLLQINYTHERSDNGQSNSANIVGEILIGDVDEDNFRATWTTISMEVGGYLIDANSPEAPTLMLGIPMRYLADVDGTPIRVENKDELMDMMIDLLIEISGEDSVNLAAIDQTRALFDSMSDEALATAFLKAPTYLAVCQGAELELGQVNEAEVEIPSPIGGAPVSALVTYSLASIDEQEGRAQIEYRSILDPEGAERLVRDLLAQVAGPEGIPEDELAGLSIERNDSASCEVNIETGLTESVTFVTETKALDQHRTETFVISAVHSSPGSE